VGLDPSLTATGIARPDGTMHTVGGDAKLGDQRLARIADFVERVLIEDRPLLAVLEDLPAHAQAGGITGMAQGVVRLALQRAGVPYVRVVASSLKKYATGKGNATKADMRMALYQRFGIDVKDDNQVDAWWLRAMGLDRLGRPLVVLPQANRASLAKAEWPALALEAL